MSFGMDLKVNDLSKDAKGKQDIVNKIFPNRQKHHNIQTQ